MRLLRVLFTIVAGVLLFVGGAHANDAPSREEQIRRIRALPADERRRLKDALARFNALPAAERDALRAKAKAVGAERLGELAGRDFGKLRKKHAAVQRETDEVIKWLGGDARFAGLSPAEGAYVRHMVMRNFQRYCRQRLLEEALLDAGFDKLPAAAQRERREKAAEAAIEHVLAEKTPEEHAAYEAMTPAERREVRVQAMIEWRLRRTTEFAKRFDSYRLLKIIDMPPEERHRMLASQVRWNQILGLLHSEGTDRDTLRMLGQLRADERAQVALVYEQARDEAAADRLAKVKDKIRELYGAGTLDRERLQRPAPRLPEILRERARHERERRATQPPPPGK